MCRVQGVGFRGQAVAPAPASATARQGAAGRIVKYVQGARCRI